MREVSDEMLMAYADGELDARARAEVERALAEDASLRRALEVQQALRSKLAAHYAPLIDEPLPARLTEMLDQPARVVDLAAAREKRRRHFGWPQLGAIAASLAVGVAAGQLAFGPGRGPVAVEEGVMVARGDLARTLQTRLASAQPRDAETRVGISFQDRSGRLCRTFAAPALEGIACRSGGEWAIVMAAAAPLQPGNSEYRQAGSPLLMEQAQAMIAAAPLDAEGERRALQQGWQAER
jgi:hypothetical protein